MRVEKEGPRNEGGHVGGFFQLFDWTSKSKKKLFATKSDLPESLKQRRKVDGNLATMLPYLVDEDGEIGVGGGIRESGDHSCATSATDDEVSGTRAPGVVARLMGLDSLPSSSFSDSYSTPCFDSQCIQDVQYWRTKLNHHHDHQILYSGKLAEKTEGTSRSFMEAMPLQTRSRPIEKFQTEVMPPKSAKSIPLTHHKLLSPIKGPGFVPSNNATYIMEAAARIIEPSRQVAPKAKTPLVTSSTVSLRVRDLKEKVEASQKGQLLGSSSLTSTVRDTKGKRETSLRTSKHYESSQRLTDSNDAKYLKGQQSLNKSGNGSVDTPVRSSTQVEEDSFSKNKGKSLSLAIQAKVNVQRREGLSFSSGKSLVEHIEQCDTKTPQQPLKPNVKKSLHKKSSGQDASGVLRQNNQKQNCSMDKDKLASKPLVSNSHGRKVVIGDSSSGRHRSSSNKSIAKPKIGPKKSSMNVTDSEKEVLYTRTNNFPRKKRSTDRDWNDRDVDNLFIDKSQNSVQSNLVSNKHHGGAEEVKKKDMDVVSFTFTTPLTRSNSGFETSGLNSLDQHIRRALIDTETDSARSPVGYNAIGGDALGILLDQKLRELTYGVGKSCDGSLKARSPSSTAPKSKDLVPTLNSVNLFPRLEQKKDQDIMLTDKLFSNWECDNSFTCLPDLSSKNRLRLDKVDECKINPMEAELFNSGQPSPMSVLDPSFSTESCDSPFSANAASSEDKKRRKQVVRSGSGYTDLFDSASARTMLKKQASTCSQMKFGQSSTWELDYVNDILCNVELMYMDFSLGRARDIVNPHLFNQLENRRGRFESDGGECRIRRKVIFDCVRECLDLRCRCCVGGGYKMWAKGVAMVRRNEWLAREVWKEISSWRDMGDSMVDELVDKDMSIQHGRWLDFEVDTFQLGAVVEDQIFDSLVDDFVAEILQL
ncbi:unnamed protein product [Sphenostylis stenocarpa]|uniref:DUF4378 domain-containing protein n=1 Tax=Sphenostylis stenocarpa TaxID=92480 RepID=A0AA86S685_9FABA|nr:unnamed protein product [Sphenostylis stenocarpa]